jgi:gamma-glutamyltranspeptidase/glutathione hydrolase
MRFSQLILVFISLIQWQVSFAKPNEAAIASAHPLATEAGIEILQLGGNAFDAAIAVSAALAVVEPAGSGLGGGGFWLLHRAEDGFETMVDGRETAPEHASRDMYLDEAGNADKQRSLNGPLAAGIPGLPAALDHMSKHYGVLPLSVVLAPAIRYAEEGFKVSSHYQQLAKYRLTTLKASPTASAIFLTDNQLPAVGDLIIQTDLAKTLKAIADKGRSGFYQGDIATKLVNSVQQHGGIWTHSDLTNYQIKERQPVKINYHGYQITSAALPSSGGIVIGSMLNQLSYLPYETSSKVDKVHLLAEVMRRAYYDRSRFLGDADFVTVPVKQLLDKAYGKQLARSISLDKASNDEKFNALKTDNKGEDTTHFSIIDHDGNRVAATLSINYPFGSGFVAEGTGVLLNDEMDDFSAKVGSANGYGLLGNDKNAIEAGKRPLSSMSPTFIENDDKLMVIGTPGGSRIITMVLLGMLDFMEGKSASDIVAAPRFHHQYSPNAIQIESIGFEHADLEALKAKGHTFKPLDRQYGNMQVVIKNKISNTLSAASDPRGEGESRVELISH